MAVAICRNFVFCRLKNTNGPKSAAKTAYKIARSVADNKLTSVIMSHYTAVKVCRVFVPHKS